ncbi:MAG: SUMF1/EgtB/PvdO family nonheme iron enzyme [Anaerolineae bacterium]|nr:SUMF1/EgtB/PvdO family nonheme iron enzyme [Anaerolineae bacterium]
MSKIFISYRRGETIDITGRIYDWLIKYFGKAAIFRDLNAIPYGANFRRYISQSLHTCNVMLLIIGKEWVDMKGEDGQRRLDDAGDAVRLEIEEAIANKLTIIPVLVQGAKMPKATQLPPTIREVTNLNAIEVASGADFPQHIIRLVTTLQLFVKMPNKGGKASRKAGDGANNTNGSNRKPKPSANKPVSISEVTPEKSEKLDKPEKKATPKAVDPNPKAADAIATEKLENAAPPKPSATKERPSRSERETDPAIAQTKSLQISTQRAKVPAAMIGHESETISLPLPGAPLKDRLLNSDTVIVRIPAHISRAAVDARKLIELMDWCDIPAGKIAIPMQTLSAQSGLQIHDRVYTLDAYSIGKFVITSSQFNVFTAANDGYNDLRWWQFSSGALDWRVKHPVAALSAPGRDDLPRVNVNWYEAMAFCFWLSYKVGIKILLPTEQQWQRAAQGNDQREYPWGNVFDAGRSNTLESGAGGLTLGIDYPKGRSPFNVYDVAGNVQQWTLNEFATGSSTNLSSGEGRVIRGSSWKFKANRLTQRFRMLPYQQTDYVGFRIVINGK